VESPHITGLPAILAQSFFGFRNGWIFASASSAVGKPSDFALNYRELEQTIASPSIDRQRQPIVRHGLFTVRRPRSG
jgi:hypothetical protein